MMFNHVSIALKLTSAGLALLAVGAVAPLAATAEPMEPTIWLRANACSRAERSAGLVDVAGDCLRDDPAFGHDVERCAGHFCPAQPGDPGAHLIDPTDFGPTD